jgi:hypothetical protein
MNNHTFQGSESILSWSFVRVVDYQHIQAGLPLLQLQAQLLFERDEKGGTGRVVVGDSSRRVCRESRPANSGVKSYFLVKPVLSITWGAGGLPRTMPSPFDIFTQGPNRSAN